MEKYDAPETRHRADLVFMLAAEAFNALMNVSTRLLETGRSRLGPLPSQTISDIRASGGFMDVFAFVILSHLHPESTIWELIYEQATLTAVRRVGSAAHPLTSVNYFISCAAIPSITTLLVIPGQIDGIYSLGRQEWCLVLLLAYLAYSWYGFHSSGASTVNHFQANIDDYQSPT
ncbi:uncharacterized protein RSE6_13200 [Rhynchosporium secalis]|uniref:Uncharacterized protein n=1 Tax=Rhynchosporium secalis TaxID=38038 RepID=A0A1E1MSA4_RHYSE|nr:uncharacterized protein RSE6_13200 [Rhynchosporium secalis]